MFGFMSCPLCKEKMSHPSLRELVDPLNELEELVRRKSLLRLQYERLDKSAELTDPASRWYKDPTGFAMHKFAYFLCKSDECRHVGLGLGFAGYSCGKPYYGGEARCGAAADAAAEARFDPSELICSNCVPHAADADCPKHSRDFVTWKVASPTELSGCLVYIMRFSAFAVPILLQRSKLFLLWVSINF
jgi:E3 ubiquitin-protein ligase MYCBP2